LRRLPDGPRLEWRYIHRLTLLPAGLTERQRELLETLVHSVDGAQLALARVRARVGARARSGAPADARAREDARQRAQLDRRIALLERRFWRLVTIALAPAQRVDLKDLLPEKHVHPPNALGHLFLVEDMTPSQANRTVSMLKEYESETAPDLAAARRLRALGKPGEAKACDRRVQDRFRMLYRDLETVFTKKQWTELRGLMPFVPPEDRRKHPGDIVKAARPRADQIPRLEELGARIAAVHERVAGEAERKRKAMDAEIGEESPQAMTMRMMGAFAEAKVAAAIQDAAHEAVVGVLDPDQVALWLLSDG